MLKAYLTDCVWVLEVMFPDSKRTLSSERHLLDRRSPVGVTITHR